VTPLQRAQRAVERWNAHWAKSAAINLLLVFIKREIEEAVQAERARCAAIAAKHETEARRLVTQYGDDKYCQGRLRVAETIKAEIEKD